MSNLVDGLAQGNLVVNITADQTRPSDAELWAAANDLGFTGKVDDANDDTDSSWVTAPRKQTGIKGRNGVDSCIPPLAQLSRWRSPQAAWLSTCSSVVDECRNTGHGMLVCSAVGYGHCDPNRPKLLSTAWTFAKPDNS